MTLGRHIRPFPTRRLLEHSTLVQTRAVTVQQELLRALQENGTWSVTEWRYSLGVVMDTLQALEEACADMRAQCGELDEAAERDYENAGRAAEAMLRGLVAKEEALVEQRRAALRVIPREAA